MDEIVTFTLIVKALKKQKIFHICVALDHKMKKSWKFDCWTNEINQNKKTHQSIHQYGKGLFLLPTSSKHSHPSSETPMLMCDSLQQQDLAVFHLKEIRYLVV